MSPVPAIVRAYAADIARYRLYADAATEAVRTRYEDAIKFFRAVSRREVMLGATPPAPTGGEAVMQGGRQVFHGGGF
jgi:phage gp36-like protein